MLAVNIAKMLSENASAEVDAMGGRAALAVQRAQAAAAKAVYAAEGKAATALKDKRAFELAKRQIDVYQSLASNGKVSFFGSDAGGTVPNMVTVGGRGSGGSTGRGAGGADSGGNGPWDTVRQLTESIAQRIAHGVVADGRSDGSSP